MFGPQSIAGPGNVVATTVSAGGNFQSNLSDSLSGTYCVNFDGSDDWLKHWGTTTFVYQMIAGASWTVSFQVNFGASAASKTIWFKGSTTSYNWVYTNSGGDLVFGSQDSGVLMFEESWDTNFTSNTWYNVVIVLDGSGSDYEAKCYVDGSEVASVSDGSYSVSNSLNHGGNKLGFAVLLNAVFYAMVLDEINFWTVALDAANVAAIFNNNAKLTVDKGDYDQSDKLWASYRFEEGTGTTIADTSGGGRPDLVLVNATWVDTVRAL